MFNFMKREYWDMVMQYLMHSDGLPLFGHRAPAFPRVPRQRDLRTPEQVDRLKEDAEARRERKRIFRLRQAGASSELLDLGYRAPDVDGGWLFPCSSCTELAPIMIHPVDFIPEDHWCGTSPRCCP